MFCCITLFLENGGHSNWGRGGGRGYGNYYPSENYQGSGSWSYVLPYWKCNKFYRFSYKLWSHCLSYIFTAFSLCQKMANIQTLAEVVGVAEVGATVVSTINGFTCNLACIMFQCDIIYRTQNLPSFQAIIPVLFWQLKSFVSANLCLFW